MIITRMRKKEDSSLLQIPGTMEEEEYSDEFIRERAEIFHEPVPSSAEIPRIRRRMGAPPPLDYSYEMVAGDYENEYIPADRIINNLLGPGTLAGLAISRAWGGVASPPSAKLIREFPNAPAIARDMSMRTFLRAKRRDEEKLPEFMMHKYIISKMRDQELHDLWEARRNFPQYRGLQPPFFLPPEQSESQADERIFGALENLEAVAPGIRQAVIQVVDSAQFCQLIKIASGFLVPHLRAWEAHVMKLPWEEVGPPVQTVSYLRLQFKQHKKVEEAIQRLLKNWSWEKSRLPLRSHSPIPLNMEMEPSDFVRILHQRFKIINYGLRKRYTVISEALATHVMAMTEGVQSAAEAFRRLREGYDDGAGGGPPSQYRRLS